MHYLQMTSLVSQSPQPQPMDWVHDFQLIVMLMMRRADVMRHFLKQPALKLKLR
jgi:hypothetical protein